MPTFPVEFIDNPLIVDPEEGVPPVVRDNILVVFLQSPVSGSVEREYAGAEAVPSDAKNIPALVILPEVAKLVAFMVVAFNPAREVNLVEVISVALRACRLEAPDIPKVAPDIDLVTCREFRVEDEDTVRDPPIPTFPVVSS